MKTLIWDVEKTDLDLRVKTYQLKNYTKYFDPKFIERDWTLLGAAWIWLDKKTAQAISVSPENPLDDYGVTKKLHEVLSEADILVGHNSDAFDFKSFNTRAIFYDLPPISPKRSIDTLKVARKYFKFTSNKLSYICDYLGLELKDESPDWDKCLAGDPKELRYMRKYNKQDVIATKDLYLKLRGYHYTHPDLPEQRDINGNPVHVCKKCASPNLKKSCLRYTTTGRPRQQWQCKDCHSYTTGALV